MRYLECKQDMSKVTKGVFQNSGEAAVWQSGGKMSGLDVTMPVLSIFISFSSENLSKIEVSSPFRLKLEIKLYFIMWIQDINCII